MKPLLIITNALTSGNFIFNFVITYISGLGVLNSYSNVILSAQDKIENKFWQVFWLTIFSIIFAYGVFYVFKDLKTLTILIYKSLKKIKLGKRTNNASDNSD